MNSGLVLQGHHAQYTPIQCFDCGPESIRGTQYGLAGLLLWDIVPTALLTCG